MEIQLNEVAKTLETVGIICDVNMPFDNIMVEDSLEFIAAVVEIENKFNISFPDEYLDGTAFSSLSFLTQIINEAALSEKK